jgi:hypothetical protein
MGVLLASDGGLSLSEHRVVSTVRTAPPSATSLLCGMEVPPLQYHQEPGPLLSVPLVNGRRRSPLSRRTCSVRPRRVSRLMSQDTLKSDVASDASVAGEPGCQPMARGYGRDRSRACSTFLMSFRSRTRCSSSVGLGSNSVQGRLPGFDISKGTIRFTIERPIPMDAVTELVRMQIREIES